MDRYEKIPAGGTPLAAIRTMGGSRATLEFGRSHMESGAAAGGGSAPGTAASFLAQRFAVPHYPVGTPIGLRETDAFFQALEHLAQGKTPANHALEPGRVVDAYVADTQFRKRDPRFTDVDRYKERSRRERRRRFGHNRRFTTEDFSFAADLSYCLCPAGKRLYRSGGNVVTKGLGSVRFKGVKSACLPCSLRSQCLRHPERTEIRQVAYFHGRTEKSSFATSFNPFATVTCSSPPWRGFRVRAGS